MAEQFDKYDLYARAVQDPPAMCDFLDNVYRDICRRSAHRLAEDFCGSFALSHEWVTRDGKNSAVAVDKAILPLRYGKSRYWESLAKEERSRLAIHRRDVRSARLPPSDIVCALNFSYGVFLRRRDLLAYLNQARKRLLGKGIVVLDVLGGAELGDDETRTEYAGFSYFWEQESFDPVSRLARFHIHFQRPGEKKRRRVFTYDWRLWTVPELRDLFEEAGFRRSHVYWEGAGRLADGDKPGCFRSWVAYVVGER